LTVESPRGHDAETVCCAGCGAAREAGTKSCAFCGSDFTLFETDRHTMCPHCLTRVSDRGRHCHHCGGKLTAETLQESPVDHACPICGPERKLYPRHFDSLSVQALECRVCGGLWMGIVAFHEMLHEQATQEQTVPPAIRRQPAVPAPPAYRRCVDCGEQMLRHKMGRVIIDVCGRHGIWFDDQELSQLLHWARNGGLAELRAKAGRWLGTPEEFQTPGAMSAEALLLMKASPEVNRRLAGDSSDASSGSFDNDTVASIGYILGAMLSHWLRRG
jgi:Zn-finger nucleic acid-binding protein